MRGLQFNERTLTEARIRHNAFTLIELRVLIGIIAILIAILLPIVSRARESATKAACLSNLHQIAIYLQEYQNRFRGKLPIYITAKYADKTIYHGGVNDYTNLGLLVAANIVPESGSEAGRVFYRPGSTVGGTRRRFNCMDPSDPAGSNPWVGRPGYSTRITYSQRPEYWVWDGTTTYWNIQYPNAHWDMDQTTASQDVFIHPPSNTLPLFPRVETFNRGSASALITDLIDVDATNRRLIHCGGWNVLYANWSAKFVPQQCFARHVENLETQEAANPNGGPAVKRAWFDLWQELDQY